MLTIEPKVITEQGNDVRLATADVTVGIHCVIAKDEAAQLAEALAHFAAHGTFCPEPVKSLIWDEPIKDTLWVHGDWFIQRNDRRDSEPTYCAWHGGDFKFYTHDVGSAKSYAESRIRESTKETK